MKLKCVDNKSIFGTHALTIGKLYTWYGSPDFGTRFLIYNDEGKWDKYLTSLFIPEVGG